jgi:hypothetical protein
MLGALAWQATETIKVCFVVSAGWRSHGEVSICSILPRVLHPAMVSLSPVGLITLYTSELRCDNYVPNIILPRD